MTTQNHQPADRRPLTSRDLSIFQKIAAALAARNVSANAISMTSVFTATIAGIAFVATAHTAGGWQQTCWVIGAIMIQLRLLANLLDGMVAIEGGQASPVGELYNEVPDRIADAFIIIGVGYAWGGSPELGYLATIVAIFTAYVRAVGASMSVRGLFLGPMAKPHRMFTLTVFALFSAFAPQSWQPILADQYGLGAVVLGLITVGSAITAARRLLKIAATVNTQANA